MEHKNITLTTIAKRADHVMWSPIGHEVMSLNMETGYYYSFNTVGARIWQMLDGKIALGEIGKALCAQYRQPQSQIEVDLLELIQECYHENLIIAC